MATAEAIIEALGLTPHPEEGGYYRETYRSEESFSGDLLPSRYGTDRSFSTAIYYLLTPDTFSEIHRIQSDEIFHFYLGDPVTQVHLYPDGRHRKVILGPDPLADQFPQMVVPRGTWQGAFLNPGGKFALLGATVSPGFEFVDYETGVRTDLIRQFPELKSLIERLTKE